MKTLKLYRPKKTQLIAKDKTSLLKRDVDLKDKTVIVLILVKEIIISLEY